MSLILETTYKSVLRLNRIVIDCIESDSAFNEFSQQFIQFCGQTYVATNDSLDFKQLFSRRSGDSLDTIFENYFQAYKRQIFWPNNRLIPKSDSIEYFNKNKDNFETLFSVLKETVVSCLLYRCIFFEEIGFNCFQQMTGFSITNNVWKRIKTDINVSNCKPSDRTIKIKDQRIIRAIKAQINSDNKFLLSQKLSQQKSEELVSVQTVANNESQRVVKTPINGNRNDNKRDKNSEIVRKSMLYSRQSSGRFRQSFILEKHCLQCHQLFADIFSESLRQQIPEKSKKSLWPFLHLIIVGHKTCRFDKLLDKHCPIGSQFMDNKEFELRIALNLYSTHKQVISFLYSVLYHVFPTQLFGNKSNFKTFFENSKLLITCGLNTVLYFPDIKHKFKFNEIKWFEELTNSSLGQLIADSLIRWLTQYILTLLKSKFYITETMKSKNLFFYRFDLWSKMKTKAIDGLVKQNYLLPIKSEELSEVLATNSTNLLSLSTYRFVPKTKDFRFINRLKPMNCSDLKEMKNLLKLTLIVLKKLKNISNENSFKSTQTLHQNILKLKSSTNRGKLFFIRADVANCYPSINQNKLFDIIEDLFKHIILDNQVFVREFDRIIKCKKRLFVKHIRYIEMKAEKSLSEIAVENNIKLQNAVIVPKSYENSYSCETIKNYIKTYIFEAIIKVSKKSFYRISSGIRQGGMLSSELCSIYVESLINGYFDDLGLLSSEVRLIQADDFLFITPSFLRAIRIIEKLKTMPTFEDYNLSINWDKLSTNFNINGLELYLINEIKFFGHLIDIQRLTVCRDYGIYCQHFINDTFNCNPNFSLKNVMNTILGQIPLHMTSLLLDNRVNETRIVTKNIYERALLQSIRLSAFLKISNQWKSKQSIQMILKFALNMAKMIFDLTQKWTQMNGIDFGLTFDEVRYVTVSAVLNQWTFGKISHRKQERKALKLLKENIGIDLKQLNSLTVNCNEFIPNQRLVKPFNQILFK